MPTLQETTNDYLLATNYYQKDRAKAIIGHRWDPKTKCWRFPRTEESYQAIMEEFREDLQGIIPDPPSLSIPSNKEIHIDNVEKRKEGSSNNIKNEYSKNDEEIQVYIKELEKKNNDLNGEYIILKKSADDLLSFQIDHFGNMLSNLRDLIPFIPLDLPEDEYERDMRLGIYDLESDIYDLYTETNIDISILTEIKNKINYCFEAMGKNSLKNIIIDSVDGLKTTNSTLEEKILEKTREGELLKIRISELENQSNCQNDLFYLAGIIAFDIAKDKIFQKHAEEIRNNPTLLIEIGKMIEQRIRGELKIEGYISFADLLYLARDKKVISQDTFCMAQTVRITRNSAAHNSPPKNTLIALSILTLFAAALVWKELPVGEK